MDRNKRRVNPSRGSKKADTPIKPALGGKHVYRHFQPKRCFEAFPEEEMADKCFQPTTAVLIQKKAIQPRFQMCTTGVQAITMVTENTAGETSPFNSYEHPSKKRLSIKYKQTLKGVSESTNSSIVETDTINSNTEDDERCSSVATSSSSLPSPEIFRKGDSADSWISNFQTDPLDFTLTRKNSTLMEATYAKNICMYHPPNISAIIDDSPTVAETNSKNRDNTEPEGEAEKQTDLKKPNGPKLSTRFRIGRKMSVRIKKKVTFKSPVIVCDAEHVKLCESDFCSKSVQTSEQTQKLEETAKPKQICIKSREMNQEVKLKKAVNRNPKEAKFFDFTSDTERDLFLQNARDRCVKLRSLNFLPNACFYV